MISPKAKLYRKVLYTKIMTKKKEVQKSPKKALKKSKSKEEIVNIYAQESADSDELIDMTKLDQGKGQRKKKILIGATVFLFVLAAVSVVGYWLFTRDYQQGEGKVGMTLDTPDEVASGEMVTLTITYNNQESVALAQGEVSMHYPEGFYFQQAQPQAEEGSNNTWKFEDLAAGAGGKITITGQIVGEKQDEKSFSALLIYRPSNFQNDFQEIVNKTITINESVVDLDVEVPLRVQSGEEITYKVKYKNISSLPLPNVKALLNYPSGFEVTSVSPTPSYQNNIWQADSLEQDEEQELVVKGVINGKSGDNKEFKFKLGLLEPDGNFNLQVEKTSLILVVNPDLELSIEAPESTELGEELNYKITVKNTSDVEIENLEIALDFIGQNVTQKQVVLDKIESLPAHDEEILKYKVKVKNKLEGDTAEIKAIASVASAKVEGESVEFDQEAKATTKIASDVTLSAEARYYTADLEKIGSGPIPPEVNKTTSYYVYWDIKAGSNDLENVIVQTTLPDDVLWEGSEDSDVEYSKTTRLVSWNINELAAQDSQEVGFMVSITPTPDDIGKLMELTKQTIAQGLDTNTEDNIEVKSKKVTTDLEHDEVGADKGVVVGN